VWRNHLVRSSAPSAALVGALSFALPSPPLAQTAPQGAVTWPASPPAAPAPELRRNLQELFQLRRGPPCLDRSWPHRPLRQPLASSAVIRQPPCRRPRSRSRPRARPSERDSRRLPCRSARTLIRHPLGPSLPL